MKQANNGFFFEKFFGLILSPFERFLRRTTAGGIILIVTVAISLALANSHPGREIFSIWEQPLTVGIANWQLQLSLHQWVNEGLMTLFFLLVGLELKRELIVGELSSIKDASVPIIAALGGMIVPAVIYSAINPAGLAARGWGVPMATDIAFAVGILVLLGRRIPAGLTVFLTAVAIADDLGAVIVIAFFYTGTIALSALLSAAVLLVLLFILNRGGIRNPLPYAFIGLLLWFSLLRSGVHPTIAGILLACSIPAKSTFTPPQFALRIEQLQDELDGESTDPHACDQALSCPRMIKVAENLEHAARAVQSPQQHMEHALSPWVTFVVLPIFAFSNLGIDFSKLGWNVALSPIAFGVALGLVAGKLIGISTFSFIAVKIGIGRLPKGITWKQIIGVAWLGGIGFTMSLFIGNLAFADPDSLEAAKIGILAASLTAGTVGLAWLRFACGREGPPLKP